MISGKYHPTIGYSDLYDSRIHVHTSRRCTYALKCNVKDILAISVFLELEDVITADGTIKMMMVVNNQLPGPPIVVYEGQEVSQVGIFCHANKSSVFLNRNLTVQLYVVNTCSLFIFLSNTRSYLTVSRNTRLLKHETCITSAR